VQFIKPHLKTKFTYSHSESNSAESHQLLKIFSILGLLFALVSNGRSLIL